MLELRPMAPPAAGAMPRAYPKAPRSLLTAAPTLFPVGDEVTSPAAHPIPIPLRTDPKGLEPDRRGGVKTLEAIV